MGVCSLIKEFFYGKDDVAAQPVEKPKVIESFCRSDRINEFVARLTEDLAKTGAEYFCIKVKDDPTEYRGTLASNKIIAYNCDTLDLLEDIRELYVRGIESGSYHSTDPVRDERRYHTRSDQTLKKEWECMPRFKNKVVYYDSHYEHASLIRIPKARTEQKNWWEYRDLILKYNKGVRFQVLRFKDKDWGVEYARLESWLAGRSYQQTLFNMADPEETLVIPGFIVEYIVNKYPQAPVAIDREGNPTVLYDPIRVTELKAGEDEGNEGYVALRKGVYNGTFTRLRYRIEVDTEELFANKIVSLQALFEDIAARINWMTVPDDGKLYLDNIICMHKDGTTHTLDNSGFRTIGAEVFWNARARLMHSFLSGGQFHESGFWMITQNEFPKEPTY